MVTVLRQDGFRFVIYLDDHEPAHVHVYAGGAEAKIALISPIGRPAVVRVHGMRMGELRKALQLVGEHRAMLLAKWEEIHG